jgi:twitching motility protein PilT
MTIFEMMQKLIELNGSDLHILTGSPPTFRVDGVLAPVESSKILTKEEAEELVNSIMTQEQKDYVSVNKETDFGYQFKDLGRFRVNVYYQQGSLCAALRLIPTRVKTIEELQLPPIFHEFTQYNQGLILLTGPTGEGKSSTLAAMIEEINLTRSKHILTIEDPVEFVYQPQKSVISQRELLQDTHAWDIALRSALREDPDVVLVGEMRDFETISATLTIAETGHLVLATLHTNSASQTVDRIIDVFPENQQAQVRQQLASVLQAIVSQRLIPAVGGGRVPATEILLVNPAVRNLIREGKTFQIDNVIQTSNENGMMLLETSLLNWAQRGAITMEMARQCANRLDVFDRLSGGIKQ